MVFVVEVGYLEVGCSIVQLWIFVVFFFQLEDEIVGIVEFEYCVVWFVMYLGGKMVVGNDYVVVDVGVVVLFDFGYVIRLVVFFVVGKGSGKWC